MFLSLSDRKVVSRLDYKTPLFHTVIVSPSKKKRKKNGLSTKSEEQQPKTTVEEVVPSKTNRNSTDAITKCNDLHHNFTASALNLMKFKFDMFFDCGR